MDSIIGGVMVKKFINLCRTEWLAALGALFTFTSVGLIALVMIEGIILMVVSEIVWVVIGYNKKMYFLVIQNCVLIIIDVFGTYYWIATEKGTWLIQEVIRWF